MTKYRVTLQFDAATDEEALATGQKLAALSKGAQVVTAEIQRAYYWEPIWVDDAATADPSAPVQIAAS